MSARESRVSPRAFEVRAWLDQTRDRIVVFALVCLFVAGLVVSDHPDLFVRPYQGVVLGLAASGIVLIVASLLAWHRGVASWALVAGYLALYFLAVTWSSGGGQIAWLLVLPVGLATLVLGLGPGLAVAAACTLVLVFAPVSLFAVSTVVRNVTLVGMWGVVGLIALMLRSLLEGLDWTWTHYEREHALLEQARGSRVQLLEALEDLNSANVQLTRMNQLTQSLQQAAENERLTKEQFVANVSHELRTPLNMIVGFCEMITEAPQTYGDEIPPSLLSDLTVVLRNSQHLSQLIDDVLDLSQIEAGQMALTKERVSLKGLVEAAVVATRPLFQSKDLSLEAEIESDLPLVFCDRTRIREVLLNLLSNAGRFTEKGGVRISAWRQENDVVVTVADTGPGIADEAKSRVFQPFQQLDASIRRRYGGTGLGLSISRSFVELHDGRMWIESESGQGTTIYFRLPVDPRPVLGEDALRWFSSYDTYEERARPFRLKQASVAPRFVVVEEGDVMQRLLTRYLDDVEIVPVSSLEQAVKEVARIPAKGVLVNDSDGGNALARLNEGTLLPRGTPAMICSLPGVGYATGMMGISDYLVKPISRTSLLSSLDRLESEVHTVLVVDDERDALQLFWRMLSSAERGYRVLRAYDGRQALEILQHQRPDVILLDLVMPELDGFEFLKIKKEDPNLRDIPTIVISARDPLGHPIVSKTLSVTCSDGLSVRTLLDCIKALSAILGGSSAGSALQGALPG